MAQILLRIVIALALLVGGREFFESRAEKRLVVAQELHDDQLYDQSLEALRSLDSWYSWTRAGARGDVLREEVRSRINKERKKAQEKELWDAQMAQIDRDEKIRRDEVERERRDIRAHTSMENARKDAEAERAAKKARWRAEEINRRNDAALRKAKRY